MVNGLIYSWYGMFCQILKNNSFVWSNYYLIIYNFNDVQMTKTMYDDEYDAKIFYKLLHCKQCLL